MRRLPSLLLILALLGLNSNQAVTRGFFFSNIGSSFSWSGSAQAAWSGSTRAATCSDYTTFIHNDGTACSPSNALVQFGFATAHAVNSNPTHTPIVANNTFASGLTPWTSANLSACSGALFSQNNSPGEDPGNGYASSNSLGCTATAAQVTLVQAFTTGGAPTSQTYSFYYNAPIASSGDPACDQEFGSASLAVKVNSTTLTTIAITPDGAWHQVSGTMSAMVSGSNTLTFTATLSGARGETNRYNARTLSYACAVANTNPQVLQIDNVVLSGVW